MAHVPRVRAAFILTMLTVSPAWAQADRPFLTVDLASARSDTSIVSPGTYTLRIINLVPRFVYSIQTVQRTLPVAPLPLVVAANPQCNAPRTVDLLRRLSQVQSEEEVAEILPGLAVAARDEAIQATPACATLAAQTTSQISRAEYTHPDVIRLRRGDILTVTVTRSGGGGSTRVWTDSFATEATGEWQVSYGFTFPFLKALIESPRYFSGEADDTTYVITRERSTRYVDAIPTVYYSYIHSGRGILGSGLDLNLITAGLGLDIDEPTLALGTGLIWRKNLFVTGGLAARREQVLSGKFEEGQVVREILTDAELYESEFRIRPFVSVSLRFDRSPFGGGGDDDALTEAAAVPDTATP